MEYTESRLLAVDLAPIRDTAPITHEILEGEADIASERPLWDNLVAANYEGSPFLRPDWLMLRMRQMTASGDRLLCVKIYRGLRVAAYVPLLTGVRPLHQVRARVLMLAAARCAPVACPILAHRSDRPVFDYFVHHVLPTLQWDALDMGNMPEEHPGGPELTDALGQGGYDAALHTSGSQWVWRDGPMAYAQYRLSLPEGLLQRMRAESLPPDVARDLRFRLVSGPPTRQELDCRRLLRAQTGWVAQDEEDISEALIQLTAQRGWLRMGMLHSGGQLVAAQTWLACNHRAWLAERTHLPSAGSRFGAILAGRMLDHLMDQERIASFDMLPDDRTASTWGNECRRRQTIVAFNHGVRARALQWLDRRLLPWVRQGIDAATAGRRAKPSPAMCKG